MENGDVPSTLNFYRSEGFPARDIWFLGVMLPGFGQIYRVLGTLPPPSLPMSSDSSWLRDPPFKSAYLPPGFANWFGSVAARMVVQFTDLIES